MFKRKTEFIDWDKWKGIIDYVSVFRFQQKVRHDNLEV